MEFWSYWRVLEKCWTFGLGGFRFGLVFVCLFLLKNMFFGWVFWGLGILKIKREFPQKTKNGFATHIEKVNKKCENSKWVFSPKNSK